MKNPGLPDVLWKILDQRLWHATGRDELHGIITAGQIMITGDRYKDSLCRHLGYVSLFDFGPSAKDVGDQFRNWRAWFGSYQESRVAIWLEIDRNVGADNICDAEQMHAIWNKHLCRQFIPGVEAGHKDPIPLRTLKGALAIDRSNLYIFERHEEVNDGLLQRVSEFENSLSPAPPENSILNQITATLNAGRRKLSE